MIKTVRRMLGSILLTLDRLVQPKAIQRPSEYQEKVDRQSQKLKLYQFEACPFCLKVRRVIKRLNLKIESRDVLENPKFKEELVREGGQYQVPCLKIEKDNGEVQWMYESSDINRYLIERFSE